MAQVRRPRSGPRVESHSWRTSHKPGSGHVPLPAASGPHGAVRYPPSPSPRAARATAASETRLHGSVRALLTIREQLCSLSCTPRPPRPPPHHCDAPPPPSAPWRWRPRFAARRSASRHGAGAGGAAPSGSRDVSREASGGRVAVAQGGGGSGRRDNRELGVLGGDAVCDAFD